MDFPKKKIEAMSKGYFFDQAVTIFCLKTFFSSLDFPVFKIGLFSKWIFQKIEAMSKGYVWDDALTIFLKTFFSSLVFPVFKIGLFQNGFFQKKN